MTLILANLVLIPLALYLFFKKNLLSYLKGGNIWLTWIAIGVITLMDELTSIFYAPSEAFGHIGIAVVVFIPITAVLIHYMTTRMVEVAEVLDAHDLKGGGVYNFSYLILGPLMSFIAVASILVDYVLTAAISSVSAVSNLIPVLPFMKTSWPVYELIFIWLIAGLNILGIRENTKVTFGIFLVTAVVFLNLVIACLTHLTGDHFSLIGSTYQTAYTDIVGRGWIGGYGHFIASVSSCILAYSGIESVMQTASLVEGWKVVKKAYIFLALSVGILTPLVTVLVFSMPGVPFAEHSEDLIVFFSTQLLGAGFGQLMAFVAGVCLLMAVNTAFVASSELIERVAHRYGFHWIIKTNKRASLHRVHIANALFFSFIILITQGGQKQLAEMYAVGLVASFTINLLCSIIYRYTKGTSEVREFNVSRIGTIFFFVIISSCFVYLCWNKPAGFILWMVSTVLALIVGVYGVRKRSPEKKQIEKGETTMDIVLKLAEGESDNIHLYFKRPLDVEQTRLYDESIFITFYNPREPIPQRIGGQHFRIPIKGYDLHDNMVALIDLLNYDLAGKNITVHFGWPTSSWFDRMSIGVMVFKIMRLPKQFPGINFKIEKFRS